MCLFRLNEANPDALISKYLQLIAVKSLKYENTSNPPHIANIHCTTAPPPFPCK